MTPLLAFVLVLALSLSQAQSQGFCSYQICGSTASEGIKLSEVLVPPGREVIEYAPDACPPGTYPIGTYSTVCDAVRTAQLGCLSPTQLVIDRAGPTDSYMVLDMILYCSERPPQKQNPWLVLNQGGPLLDQAYGGLKGAELYDRRDLNKKK